MRKSLRIPEERVPVLLGKDGKTKKDIEESSRCTLYLSDSTVTVEGKPMDVMRTLDTVKAIGRGFPPKDAILLLNDEFILEVKSLQGETKKTIKRLKGRVIGRNGTTRRIIEDTTHCHISVYGKTISIIGEPKGLELASRAVDDLLSGRSHGYVYRNLRG